MHVNPVQKEAIRHTIKHKIVSFIFRYGQPVAGMPQTGATVATATSYPGTEKNVPYVVAMLLYCSHHAITPAAPYTSLTFPSFLSLLLPFPLPLPSSSPPLSQSSDADYSAAGYQTQQQQQAAYGAYTYPQQQAASSSYPASTVAYSTTTTQPTQMTTYSATSDQTAYGAMQRVATTVAQTSQLNAGYMVPSQTTGSTGKTLNTK